MLTSAAWNQNYENNWPGGFGRAAATLPRCNMISVSPNLGEHRFVTSDPESTSWGDALKANRVTSWGQILSPWRCRGLGSLPRQGEPGSVSPRLAIGANMPTPSSTVGLRRATVSGHAAAISSAASTNFFNILLCWLGNWWGEGATEPEVVLQLQRQKFGFSYLEKTSLSKHNYKNRGYTS